MSMYQPLCDFLLKTPEQEITLSFERIEQILGSSLPYSAHEYRQWWANQEDTNNRPQAKAWTDVGFEVADIQQTGGRVTFKRLSFLKNIPSPQPSPTGRGS